MRKTSFYGWHIAALWTVRSIFLAIGLTWPTADALSAADQDNGVSGYFRNWFALVDEEREEQPNWVAPIVTATPRLEEQVREDFIWQKGLNGRYLTNYGAQKGLELIPTENTEVIIGIPTYQVLRTPQKPFEEVGLADMNFLLKYRFLAASEERGNYILTGFLGMTIPTGVNAFTTHQVVYTPTLAAGKGWGTRSVGFDIQSTVSASMPDGHEKAIGVPIVWNTALQLYGFTYLWPEFEFNYTHWIDGPITTKGKNQLAVTPGLVLGRFPIWDRVRALVGLGYQTPITSFRTQDHTWLLTIRFPF